MIHWVPIGDGGDHAASSRCPCEPELVDMDDGSIAFEHRAAHDDDRAPVVSIVESD